MIDFIKEMTVGNVFLMYHLFGGLFFGRFFGLWKRCNPVVMTLVVAIIWEVIELYINGGISVYGSTLNYIADTTGDISGGVLMAWVVVR